MNDAWQLWKEESMRVFIAGATGAIGRRLVPLLVENGHQVVGTTRTPAKVEALRAEGAEAVVVDGLNGQAVMEAVVAARPDAIVHQMTALASMRSLKHFDDEFAMTNRLRTEGTRHLLAAALAAGTRTFVAQSYTGWPNERRGSRIKTEEDPLDADPPEAVSKTLAAMRELEEMVSKVFGTVVRYGALYGPGTSLADDGEIVQMIRERKFPLVGEGTGVWSFIHVDDAARATQLAIERGTPGVFNIVDDDPAEVSVWLPELAQILGAKPPLRVPAWIGRFAIGEAGVTMMTEIRGSSNAKARRILGFEPRYSSWRDGFRRGLSDAPALAAASR
jgi:nucleoside-diphosphate-sugar epimerase